MTNPADEHIVKAIKELVLELDREYGYTEEATRLVDNIAKLRASMEPTIIQNIDKVN